MYKYRKEMKLSVDIQCLAWKNEYYGKDFLKMCEQLGRLEWFMFDNQIRKDAICSRDDFFEVYFIDEFEISNEIENWEHIFNLMYALKKELVDTMLLEGFSEKAIFDLFENDETLANKELNKIEERAKRAEGVCYLKNKARKQEIQKKYYKKNREKIRESQKEYKEQNKEKIKEYQKEYYQKNRERIREIQKEYREKNVEPKKNVTELVTDSKDDSRKLINQYIKAYL